LPDPAPIQGVVTTIAAKCRRCYGCVRACPARAIRVQSGQATVMQERCIGCGNCLRVCAQGAKQVESALPAVRQMLAAGAPVVALLAPSYPAACDAVSAGQIVAAVRSLGFDRVLEVGFGAEMVAAEYARLLQHPPKHPLISTACPALVNYIRKYMPELVPSLVPVVSPMTALGRAVKQHYLPGAQVVFVGPCTAKKAEIRDPQVAGAIDAALTFQELAKMLDEEGVDCSALGEDTANAPLPHYGALFPVSGGLLKAAAIRSDLMDDSVVVVEGPDRCLAALRDLSEGNFPARFLDALFCEGCIAGPAFSSTMTPLARKAKVTAHVRSHPLNPRALRRALREVADVNVRARYEPEALSLVLPNETEIRDILARTNKLTVEQELNCGACGYGTCRDKAVAVYQGLAEVDMCLPYLIGQLEINLEKLTHSKEEIEKAREEAGRAQQLASMGQLAADLAREMDSPLNSILAYAQLLFDTVQVADPRREDLATISAEALHCREIMSSLQGFARLREPHWEPATLADLVARALSAMEPNLAVTEVEVTVDIPEGLPGLFVDPAQMTQVLVTVLTNSLEALDGTGRIWIEGRRAEGGPGVELVIADNGRGIAPELLPRLFQPFVTTKGPHPGAGLGLAVAHGIVQAHGGELRVQSKPGFGTTLTIRLPLDVPTSKAPEGAKVLLVDDDPDFLEQHRLMLVGMGFTVVTAERSDEALEVAIREIPDAFVLDLMMERNDSGARLSRTLRRDPRFRRAPIILLTSVAHEMGFEFQRNPKEVLEWMKADAWFDKPAPVVELADTIRRLLTGPAPGGTGVSPGPPAGDPAASSEVPPA
jgi:signal transduction histidine kinase/iron only hydrogenase large subunit-like protein/CheY-like chemotaxis protein